VNSTSPSTTNIDDNPNTSMPGRRTAGFRPKTIRDIRREQGVESEPESTVSTVNTVAGVPAVEVPPPKARTLPITPKRITTTITPARPAETGSFAEQKREAPAPVAVPSSENDLPPVAKSHIGRVGILAASSILGLVLALAGAYFLGKTAGRGDAGPVEANPPQARGEFPPVAQSKLDSALTMLRSGDAVGAWKELEALVQRYPSAPSLRYAAAMAAMQADYLNDADRMVRDSLAANDRVSDSLALKAAIIGMRAKKPVPEQEAFLRQAIAADPMNANTLLELAALLRYQGRLEEAAGVLKSAQTRLLPVDSHIVVNTTMALLNLQNQKDLAPPAEDSTITGIPEQDIPMAYTLMRQGNIKLAAAVLKNTQTLLSPELFAYLLDDPAIRQFRKDPDLADFYR